MMDLLRAWRYSRLLDQCRAEADPAPAPRGRQQSQAYVHDVLRSPKLAPRQAAPDWLARAIIEEVSQQPCAVDTAPGPFASILRPVVACGLVLAVGVVAMITYNVNWGTGNGAILSINDAGKPNLTGFAQASSNIELPEPSRLATLGQMNPGTATVVVNNAYQRELAAIRSDTERAARVLLNTLPVNTPGFTGLLSDSPQ